ncbi:cysteine desulfurase family protein [Treponema parvum]|uniref:cysteine desulfurase family protein n=1 Tax=Treponema parvum TaxID=138851 RepID=UPI001AEC1E55|nr:aminotransferase class V-fold PLP-dependent enzyme [Treponema parvum]QTQ15925.1 aminotransferase class V-fold PLP-dependent enzyme [Treponema parvum]
MSRPEISHYFDWAATSPADEDIVKNALEESIRIWGNPSSVHPAGTQANFFLNAAREKAAAALEVPPSSLYFTSGGTEGNHIPMLSMLTRPAPATILISALEHPAVREQASALKNLGWKIITIPADSNGIITPEAVESCLTDDTVLVCVMAVNNETGAVQPVVEIAQKLSEFYKGKRRPKFHVDCVQAACKIRLPPLGGGIDSAAFSAHKICGPRGIGILYSASEFTPFLRGGGQEKNIRPGTENLFGAKAAADCLERYCISDKNPKTQERLEVQIKRTKALIQDLLTLKNCMILPHSRQEAQNEKNFSPWILQAAFKGIPGQVMVRALGAKGFYISTGSACSAKKRSRPVLEAMHVSAEERESAVRFSFGFSTTEKAMRELFEEVKNICGEFS